MTIVWSWVSFALGGVLVPGAVTCAYFVWTAIEDAITNHRQRGAWIAHTQTICGRCGHQRHMHTEQPIPGNPFNTFPACPKITYGQAPEDGEWTTRVSLSE